MSLDVSKANMTPEDDDKMNRSDENGNVCSG